jgi:hypothetical protein
VAKARKDAGILEESKDEAARQKTLRPRRGSGVQLRRAVMHHQPVDGGIHRFRRWKYVIVEVHHVVFHGDELQLAVFGNGDPHRHAGILDDLFVHNKTSRAPTQQRGAKMTCCRGVDETTNARSAYTSRIATEATHRSRSARFGKQKCSMNAYTSLRRFGSGALIQHSARFE